MHRRTSIAAIFVALGNTAKAQSSVQLSHIEANVPDEATFSQLLSRDLLAYFKANGAYTATSVDFRLLRNAPTQSGVSYPKYYAWVQAQSGTVRVAEGAVRLAAIERARFEVADYVPKTKAKGNQELLQSIFPKALVQDILKLAAQ